MGQNAGYDGVGNMGLVNVFYNNSMAGISLSCHEAVLPAEQGQDFS